MSASLALSHARIHSHLSSLDETLNYLQYSSEEPSIIMTRRLSALSWLYTRFLGRDSLEGSDRLFLQCTRWGAEPRVSHDQWLNNKKKRFSANFSFGPWCCYMDFRYLNPWSQMFRTRFEYFPLNFVFWLSKNVLHFRWCDKRIRFRIRLVDLIEIKISNNIIVISSFVCVIFSSAYCRVEISFKEFDILCEEIQMNI